MSFRPQYVLPRNCHIWWLCGKKPGMLWQCKKPCWLIVSLTHHWHIIDTSSTHHWHIIDTSLTHHWHFNTSLTHHRHIIDTSLIHHRHINSLTHHWHFNTSLTHHRHIIDTSWKYNSIQLVPLVWRGCFLTALCQWPLSVGVILGSPGSSCTGRLAKPGVRLWYGWLITSS